MECQTEIKNDAYDAPEPDDEAYVFNPTVEDMQSIGADLAGISLKLGLNPKGKLKTLKKYVDWATSCTDLIGHELDEERRRKQ